MLPWLVLAAALLIMDRPAAQEPEPARHWAFTAPERPDLPAVQRSGWPRNPIDRFVLARLEERGLEPAPEATRGELLRRVTFDLTGLPPTPAELDAFEADRDPGAFERVVDRLLATPAAAEESTRLWLDLARYADTHGMQRDQERALWRWRDQVLAAFRDNQPYDRFVTEQLAGDLLPAPSLAQRIASGFNRCNPTSDEGGLIPEEYLARYAMDRTDTFGTVFLGLTVGCAQCHDHKSDPLTQRDYYRLLGYFASFAEAGNDGGALAPEPSVLAPSPEQAARLEELEAAAGTARQLVEAPDPDMDADQRRWESAAADAARSRWLPLVPTPPPVADDAALPLVVLADGSLRAEGAAPRNGSYRLAACGDFAGATALRLLALPDDALPAGGPGRADNGNFVLTGLQLWAGDDDGALARVALGRAEAAYAQPGFAPAGVLDEDPETGWALQGRHQATPLWLALAAPLPAGTTRLELRLEHASRHRAHLLGRFVLAWTRDPELLASTATPWQVLGPDARSGGGQDAAWQERPELHDGVVHSLGEVPGATRLRRTLHLPTARTLTLALGSDDHLRVEVDGVERLVRRVERAAALAQDRLQVELAAGLHSLELVIENVGGPGGFAYEVADDGLGGLPTPLRAWFEGADAAAAAAPPAATAAMLRTWFRTRHQPGFAALRQRLTEAEAGLATYRAQLPVCMVSGDLPEPRPVHVLTRGKYDQPGERVEPGTPAFLPPLPADAPADRRALADWLFAPEQPLTARVAMNRAWLRHFGRGLVATPHDFGIHGATPSHPQLLDWLACEFVARGWDLRAMTRLMVTSATYRQSARVDDARLARDPDNLWLARMSRQRLPAEAIRDQALAVSGLLVTQLGGPSVRPYQPSGIWEAVAFPGSNTEHYRRDDGTALFRRSLYTFWKRTAPPALLAVLDAPSREQCTVERSVTNTPLQALALWNDEGLIEAARQFADRSLRVGGADDAGRLRTMFRTLLQRLPTARELEHLRAALAVQRELFAAQDGAAQLLLGVGTVPPAADLDPVELAAWTVIGNLLLGLDEALHRN